MHRKFKTNLFWFNALKCITITHDKDLVHFGTTDPPQFKGPLWLINSQFSVNLGLKCIEPLS